MVVRHGDKQQKLQVEKLTSDFRKIVEIYSASQQVCITLVLWVIQNSYRFTDVISFGLCPINLQQIAAKMKGILLINASQQDDLNQDENPNSTDKDLLFHSKQKSLQQNLQFDQSLLKEREQRVRQIEDDVLDINQIMRELNTLIYQQGENIGEWFTHSKLTNWL